MNHLNKRWDSCKALLGQRIGAEDNAAWLQAMQLEKISAEHVVFSGIPNVFFKNRILSHFQKVILETLIENFPEAELAEDPRLVLKLEPEEPDAVSVTAAHDRSRPFENHAGTHTEVSFGDSAHIPGPKSFDDFLVSDTNETAIRFCKAVAEQPAARFNPLLLVGGTGMGKSHLIQALAFSLASQGGLQHVILSTGEQFKNEVLDAITRKKMPALHSRYRSADALLMDDLDYLIISPRSQEELLHTFNELHEKGKQLVFCLEKPPRSIPGMIEPLRSRLEMGLIAELGLPDEQARLNFVQFQAKKHGLELSHEICLYLARLPARNLRQLEGAVVRIAAYSALDGGFVDLTALEKLVAPLFDQPGDTPLMIPKEKALEMLSARFGVSSKEIRGRSRSGHIASARRAAIHLLKTSCRMSYPEIGAYLGGRSHSTIIYGHNALKAEILADPVLKNKIRELEQQLETISRY